MQVTIFQQELNQFGIGFRGWNDFKQPQVPGRIEKMRSAKMFFKIVRTTLVHQMNRNAGSIGTNNGAWFTIFFYFTEYARFNIQSQAAISFMLSVKFPV